MRIHQDYEKHKTTMWKAFASQILTLTYLLSECSLTVLQVLLELPFQHLAELSFCKSSECYPCIRFVLPGALHGRVRRRAATLPEVVSRSTVSRSSLRRFLICSSVTGMAWLL